MNPSLQLTERAIGHLNQTRKWAKFLAILGLISSFIMALSGLFIGSIMAYLSTEDYTSTGGDFGTMGIQLASGMFYVMAAVCLVIAAVYFLIHFNLYRFAEQLKTAIDYSNNDTLENSFKYLKRFYEINGILVIAVFGIYILAVLIAFFTGVAL